MYIIILLESTIIDHDDTVTTTISKRIEKRPWFHPPVLFAHCFPPNPIRPALLSGLLEKIYKNRKNKYLIYELNSPNSSTLYLNLFRFTVFRRSFSDAIHVVKPLGKLRRKLIRKSLPILFTHLIFERQQYLNTKR